MYFYVAHIFLNQILKIFPKNFNNNFDPKNWNKKSAASFFAFFFSVSCKNETFLFCLFFNNNNRLQLPSKVVFAKEILKNVFA